MNWRAVTIVLATAIPIIMVAIILFKNSVDGNDFSCRNNETCVRYCCNHDLSCDGEPHNFEGFNFSRNLKQPYKVLTGLKCDNKAYFENSSIVMFLKNGQIEGYSKPISWKHYCIDKLNDEYIFYICFEPNEMESIRETYPYFMLTSLPFLIITLLVYGCIKDLRNLHGKCLMAYVSSLTVMYITLIINSLTEELLINYKISCMTIGYTLLTSLLCCFFWLNVMCYDVFKAFRFKIRTESSGQFIKFCAYAFGIPVAYMALVFILNFFQLIPESFNNNIGITSCSISSHLEREIHPMTIQWIYIYGPILLLISINMIFYGVTAWKLFCVERERTKVCRTSTSRIHHGQDNSENRTRFLCYLRLSVIMGVPWIIEILSFSLGTTWLFAASIFNCMQGFVVFITFVWIPKVTKHLKSSGLLQRNNYPPLRSRIDLTETNYQFGGSAETLVDGPCDEYRRVAPKGIQSEDYVETNQNLRLFSELKEKLSRMS